MQAVGPGSNMMADMRDRTSGGRIVRAREERAVKVSGVANTGVGVVVVADWYAERRVARDTMITEIHCTSLLAPMWRADKGKWKLWLSVPSHPVIGGPHIGS